MWYMINNHYQFFTNINVLRFNIFAIYILQSIGWLPVTSLLVYVFFNELGYGPVPWLLSGELIPLAVRTIGNGIAVTAYSLFAFVIGFTYPLLEKSVAPYVSFWLYALFSLSGVGLGLYIPETRGKTLEEIEKFFIPKNGNETPETPVTPDGDIETVKIIDSAEIAKALNGDHRVPHKGI